MSEQFTRLFSRFPDPLFNILLGVSAILTGLLVRWILSSAFVLYTRYTNYFLLKSITKHLRGPLIFFIPLLFFNMALPLMRMGPKVFNPLSKTVEILLTVAFALILINVVKVLEDYIYEKYNFEKEDNLRERKIRTQLQFVRKLVISLIVIIAAGIILLSFENMRKIGTGLLTSVGVGGIIIGFAAQRSLANLLAGFQIAFTQPIRIDDVVVVENEWGRVEEITLTYVVIRIWDQRRLILPINYFIEKPFQNWTRISSQLLGTVLFYLDYSVPVAELQKELTRLLEGNRLWDRRVNIIQVTDCKENTMEIRALVSAKNSSNLFDLRCFVREKMLEFVQTRYPESLPKLRAEIISGKFGADPSDGNLPLV